MVDDLTVNSDYATLKQTAAERMMWRHSRGISSTCSTAEDWKREERPAVCWQHQMCATTFVQSEIQEHQQIPLLF